MKKFLALILAAVMLLSMAACGGGDTPDDADTISHEFTQFGKGRITITGTEQFQNEDGENLLRIYYDYTNTSSDAIGQCPGTALNFVNITQDGNELESGYRLSSNDPASIPEDHGDDLTVQPGHTVRQTEIIEFNPDGGTISVSVYLMIGSWVYNKDDLKYFTFEIDPKNLMGAPSKALEYTKITDPKYTKGMPASGTFGDIAVPFEAAITGQYEVVAYDDEEGMKAIRVGLTYKNMADDEWPPCVVLPINAFQDGVSLSLGDTWYIDEVTAEDEAFGEYVAPGKTVSCNALFILRSDSPVEVVIETSAQDLHLGMVFKVK